MYRSISREWALARPSRIAYPGALRRVTARDLARTQAATEDKAKTRAGFPMTPFLPR